MKFLQNKTRLFFWLLLMAIIVFNCQNDQIDSEDNFQKHETGYRYKVKTVYAKDISDNRLLKETLSKIQKFKPTGISSKTVHNSEHNFYIDTDEATYIENGDYHSYTFVIYRNTSTNLTENLLLSLQADQTYRAYIVSYDLTFQEKQMIINGELIQLTDKMVFTPLIDFNSEGIINELSREIFYDEQTNTCYYIEQDISSGTGWGVPRRIETDCPDETDQNAEIDAGASGGGGGNSDNGDNGFPDRSDDAWQGGGGGNQDGSGGYDGGDATIPLIDVQGSLIRALGGDELDQEIQDWINNISNGQDVFQLYTFMEENNSTEADQFALLVIEALMDLENMPNIDEQIIIGQSFEDHNRLNCVYNKFSNGTNTISQYLKNFEGDFSVAHLELETDDNFMDNQEAEHWTAGAVTSPPENYVINITFNTDSNLNSSAENFPTIVLALELMHEMIHAEMFRKLLSCAQLPHVNYTSYTDDEWVDFMTNLRNDFPGLYDYFVRYKYGESGQISDEQHEQMAQHYIVHMVLALRDFDDNQNSIDYYKALSWIGLKDTVAWNNLPQEEKDSINARIDNIIQNETHECTN